MEAKPRSRIPDVLLALLAAGFVVLTFVNQVPYLQDLPEWVFQAEVFAATNFGVDPIHGVEVRGVPVPNSLFVLAVALLGKYVGFVLAAKMVLAATIVGMAAVVRAVFLHFDPEAGSWKALAGFPLFVVSSSYLNGYVSYQIGLLLFLAFFHLAVSKRKLGWPAVLLLSVGIYLSHATVFAALLVLVAWLALRRQIAGAAFLAVLPAVGLLAWYSLDSLVWNRRPESEVPTQMYASAKEMVQHKAYSLAKQGPYQGFLTADGTSWMEERSAFYKAGSAVNFGFALIFAACLVSALARARKGDPDPARSAAAAVAAVLAVLFLVMPPTLLQVVNIGERLVVPGIVLAVAAATFPARLWTGLAVVAAAVSLPCLAFFTQADRGLPAAKAALAAQVDGQEAGEGGDEGASFAQEEVEKVYAKTTQRLFNRRPYQFIDRYEWASKGKYGPLAFKTGMLRDFVDPNAEPPK